jgi:hypothetical protein
MKTASLESVLIPCPEYMTKAFEEGLVAELKNLEKEAKLQGTEVECFTKEHLDTYVGG